MVGKDAVDAGMGRHHAHLKQRDAIKEMIPECYGNCNQPVSNGGDGMYKLDKNMAGNAHVDNEPTCDNIDLENGMLEEWPPVFGFLDLIFAFGGIAVFLIDLVTDWWLAYGYYTKQEILPFIITVSFIVTPSVISSVISIIWYSLEHKWTNLGTNKLNLIFRILFTVLQLGRVYSVITISPATTLRKLTLALGHSDPQVVTMVLSWLSAAIAITSYYRDNRKARKEKHDIGYCGSFVYFLWRICELGPRFVLLSMCGVMFMPWCFIPIIAHFSIMVIFYAYQKPELRGICCTGTYGFPFLVLISFISIFGFVNLKEGDTKISKIVYYLLFYIENFAMTILILWYSYTDCMILGKWTHAVYIFFAGAILHPTFEILFYKYFHPHKDPICRL